MNKVFLFITLFSPTFILGQSKIEKKTIDELLKRSFEYNQINADSAIILSRQAIQLAHSSDYTYGICDGHAKLAIAYRFKGVYDSAIYYSLKAIQLAKETDVSVKASAYNNVAISYRYKGQYDEALDYFLKAANTYNLRKDYEQLGIVYNNIGAMFLFSEFPEKGYSYLIKSQDIHEQNQHEKPLADVYNNLGIYYANDGQLDKSLAYFKNSLSIEQKLENIRGINDSYFNVAAVYSMMGKLDSAIIMIQSSIELDKKIGNIQGVISDYNGMAQTLIENDEVDLAFKYLDSAKNYAKDIGSVFELALAYEQLAKAHKQVGNFEEAVSYFEKYYNLNDSLLNNQQKEIIAELETKYRTEEQQKEIQLKDLKIQNKEAELYQSSVKIYALIAIVVVILLIAILFYFYYKSQKDRQLKQAIISEKEKGLESIIEATEEERKRISKDLHDGIGQQLSGLKMAFTNLSESISNQVPEQSDQLNKLTKVIEDTAAETRMISHQMMPKVLVDSGLTDALRDMLQKSLGYANISYDYSPIDFKSRLPENIEITLYRIAQELINNIIKHAQAQHVDIQLYKAGKNIILMIEDDGQGITKTAIDGHGILNMKSRASHLKGEFNIENGPDQGTVATVRIPI